MKVFLVLDDSPVIRKVTSRILTDLGFTVVEASDGVEALEMCHHNIPDAMFVDWLLPTMMGLEFIEEFRKLENSASTRILYCTSELVIPEMTRAKRAGAHGFMMKPFNREILTHKIAQLELVDAQQDAA